MHTADGGGRNPSQSVGQEACRYRRPLRAYRQHTVADLTLGFNPQSSHTSNSAARGRPSVSGRAPDVKKQRKTWSKLNKWTQHPKGFSRSFRSNLRLVASECYNTLAFWSQKNGQTIDRTISCRLFLSPRSCNEFVSLECPILSQGPSLETLVKQFDSLARRRFPRTG